MKNLIITTVGEHHQAPSWLDGGGFDVFLIDYTKDQLFKYPGIYREIVTRGMWDYDYYWLPDEDIHLCSDGINNLFQAMKDNELDLAQPSILEAHDSFPSWDRFIHREGEDIIPTDFVEVMCPVFSKMALSQCIETFTRSLSGWGLDLAWSKILQEKDMKMAIINNVIVKHTRQVGKGGLYAAIKKLGVLPSQERKRLMREYGITEHSILNDNSTDS